MTLADESKDLSLLLEEQDLIYVQSGENLIPHRPKKKKEPKKESSKIVPKKKKDMKQLFSWKIKQYVKLKKIDRQQKMINIYEDE